MARDFVPADGDKITTSFSAHATQRTYSIWAWIDGAGGGGRGRIFEKRVAGAEVELFYYNTTDVGQPWVEYNRDWSSSSTTRWATPTNSAPTGQWLNLIVTYDGGATTNDPVIYIDNSSQSLTETNAPSGSIVTNADAYVLGARGGDSLRNFDGKLAEFAIWDRILTTGEIAALAKGYSPAFFFTSLVEYLPLIRSMVSYKNAAATDTGTAEIAHPRIIYPSLSQIRRFTTASSPAAVQRFYRMMMGVGT